MTTLTWEERVELAHRFAPRLVLCPERSDLGRPTIKANTGDYHPRSINLLVAGGRFYPGTLRALLSLNFKIMFDYTARPPVTLEALEHGRGFDQIRVMGPPIPSPDAAWQKYFALLNAVDHTQRSGRERYPVTTYARVVTRAEALAASQNDDYDKSQIGWPFYTFDSLRDDDVAVQYWFCYFFDDWYNIHEGDWEGVCVFLRRAGADWQPLGATYYAHENGSRRHWADLERDGDHPVVYVASGSHASYFQFLPNGHKTSISGTFLPGLRLKMRIKVDSERYDFVPDRARHPLVTPRVEVLLNPAQPGIHQHSVWQQQKWLAFPGSWGARELGRFIAGGPTGPAAKGLKWLNPFAWSEAECWPDYQVY